MLDVENTLFMLPGPVKMHPRVLRAMSVPAIGHRSAEFSKINREIYELLKYAFQVGDEYKVAVFSGSGTSGLEAVVASFLTKNDRVLCVTNGKFGDRLWELCKIYARPLRLNFRWGTAIDAEKIESAVEENQVRAITLCHNETSTGMTNPAEEVGKIAKKHDLFYILDGITSVAGIEVYPKKWGVDAVVLGSQKCLAAPAGVAAVAVSERLYGALRSDRAYYLNLKKHIDKLEAGDTPYTPAIPLFLAFREALLLLKEEGIKTRWAKNKKHASMLRAAVKAMGLELFPDERYASNTLTAIKYPSGIEDKQFRTMMKEELGIIIAGGQKGNGENLKGKIFRVGHMGICTDTDILATVSAIEYVMSELGHEHDVGAGTAAAIAELKRWRRSRAN